MIFALLIGSMATTQAQESDCYKKHGSATAWPDDCTCESCSHEGLKALKECLCTEEKVDSESFSKGLMDFTFYDARDGVSIYYKEESNQIIFKALNTTNKPVYVKIFEVSYTTSRNLNGKKSLTTGKINPGEISYGLDIFTSTFNKNVFESWKMDRWEWSENRYPY